jgi:hypothetical protein
MEEAADRLYNTWNSGKNRISRQPAEGIGMFSGTDLEGSDRVPLEASVAGAVRFLEVFTANIRNRSIRRAYRRAAVDFLRWCGSRGLSLERIEPVHVAVYTQEIGKRLSGATVTQQLVAIRLLFECLVDGQVVLFNPASSVGRVAGGVRWREVPSP